MVAGIKVFHLEPQVFLPHLFFYLTPFYFSSDANRIGGRGKGKDQLFTIHVHMTWSIIRMW